MRFCPRCGHRLGEKLEGGAKRLACTVAGCNYIAWSNPTPVVAALVKLDGKYVIARNAGWPRRIFSLITGYLESGESVQDAVLREVKEELGLDGTIARFLGHYTFKKRNQLIIAFEVHGKGRMRINDELAEVKVLSEEELKAYDFSPLHITEQIIEEWLSGGAAVYT